jgi:hypothetical protein
LTARILYESTTVLKLTIVTLSRYAHVIMKIPTLIAILAALAASAEAQVCTDGTTSSLPRNDYYYGRGQNNNKTTTSVDPSRAGAYHVGLW